MSLTEIKVRQAHCKEKTCFLSDEDGLSLKIEPTGRKSWCYRYTDPQTKKRRRIQLGLYPDLSLKKARQVKDDFKDNNYCFEYDTVSNVITFGKVGEEWLQFKLKNAFNDSPRCGVIAHGLNKIAINSKIKKNYPYLKAEDISDFKKNLLKLDAHPIIKKALLFKLHTGVRGAELLLAEPHHFDLNEKIWKIPALHIKQFRRKVILGHEIPDFLVPLSDQALDILKDVMQWSYGEKYIFASPRKHNQPIHFNTLNMAIRKMGYGKHQLSSHGLRSTFSTILNDSGLFQDNWIEAQLSHIDKNRTRASYNHADYLAQRTEMMQWWGDYLSTAK